MNRLIRNCFLCVLHYTSIIHYSKLYIITLAPPTNIIIMLASPRQMLVQLISDSPSPRVTWEGYGSYPEHVYTWEGYSNHSVSLCVCVSVCVSPLNS